MKRNEAIRIAIEAEIRSQNLYKALAKSFKTSETAKIFDQLVTFEEAHEAKMRQLYATEFPGEELVLIGELKMELNGINLNDPKDVLEFAISREELAQNIYLKLAEQTTDSDVCEMLKTLAVEEEQHKEILFTEIERLHGILEWYDPSELNGFMEG